MCSKGMELLLGIGGVLLRMGWFPITLKFIEFGTELELSTSGQPLCKVFPNLLQLRRDKDIFMKDSFSCS